MEGARRTQSPTSTSPTCAVFHSYSLLPGLKTLGGGESLPWGPQCSPHTALSPPSEHGSCPLDLRRPPWSQWPEPMSTHTPARGPSGIRGSEAPTIPLDLTPTWLGQGTSLRAMRGQTARGPPVPMSPQTHCLTFSRPLVSTHTGNLSRWSPTVSCDPEETAGCFLQPSWGRRPGTS